MEGFMGYMDYIIYGFKETRFYYVSAGCSAEKPYNFLWKPFTSHFNEASEQFMGYMEISIYGFIHWHCPTFGGSLPHQFQQYL
jgi:hypothetical protein